MVKRYGARLLFEARDQVAFVAGLHAREDAEACHRARLLRGCQPCELAARQAAQPRDARRALLECIDLHQPQGR